MFNLEEAIDRWKKSLRGRRAIQDGDSAELEAHLRDKIEDLVGRGMSEEAAFKAAEDEFVGADRLDADFYRVHTIRMIGRPPWQAPRFVPALFWNFLKVSVRRIKRQLGYSLLNILSLAVGLACFILFFMSWTYERSYDRSVKDASRIYRLDLMMKGGNTYANRIRMPWVPLLTDNIPEVEDAGRMSPTGPGTIRYGEKTLFFQKNTYFGDSAIFSLLSLPFAGGDARHPLDTPDSVVLSESMARSLFGEADPVGKIVRIIYSQFLAESRKADLTVRAVLRDQPEATTNRFDVVIPLGLQGRFWGFDPGRYGGAALTRWEDASDTYIKIRAGVSLPELEAKITSLAVSHMPAELSRFLTQVESAALVPLTGLHLNDKNLGIYLRLFAVIALAVIIMAGINFVNLSTALAVTRIREVGVRKIAGAGRAVLVRQFLCESLVMSASAMVLALLAIGALLPSFEAAMGRTLRIGELWSSVFLIELAGIAAAVGTLAGLYPAFYLSGMRPVQLFGLNRTVKTSRSALRKGLVFAQFAILGILMTGTLTVVRQIRLIDRAHLSFDREKTLLINIDTRVEAFDKPGLKTFKEKLLANPAVSGMTFLKMPPPFSYDPIQVRPEGWAGAEPMAWIYQLADSDFLKVFSIPVVAGRNFAPDSSWDMKEAALINETAAKALGPGSPLGKRLSTMRYGRPKDLTVIGVIGDYHDRTLHKRIEPLVVANDIWSREGASWIAVKIGGPGLKAAASSVESSWRSLFPDSVFDCVFLDDWMRRYYASEERMSRLGRVFSVLAVFVACAGLFGLVSQSTKQRRKEMGVRKVLGASLGHINWMFAKEFARPVLLSNLVAWPVAYYWGQRWLQGFAYRTGLTWWIFLLTSVLAVAASLATVGVQVFRASAENPVETLRCE